MYLKDRKIVFWAMLTVNIGPGSSVVEEAGVSGVPDSIRFSHKFTMCLHYFLLIRPLHIFGAMTYPWN